MTNPIEGGRKVNPNLLTGGFNQLVLEGWERAAEEIVSSEIVIPPTSIRRSSSKTELSQEEKREIAKNEPRLFGKSSVKYRRFSGEILIPQYKPLTSTQKKQAIQREQGQKKLNIKADKRSGEPIWYFQPTIERAIGSRVHILEKYQPTDSTPNQDTQIQRIENIIDFTKTLMDLYRSGEITIDNLAEYYGQTYDLLKRSGFLGTWVPNRKDAINQALEGVDLDSLGRLNPTAASMKLASSSNKWIIELFIGDKIITKHQNLLLGFVQERAFERFNIEQVIQETRAFLKLKTDNPLTQERKKQLFETVLELFRHNSIKTAPYRIPAFRFLFEAFGIPNIRNSGLQSLFTYMFGPNTKNLILYPEKIQQDFLSDDLDAQLRFRARLKKGIRRMKKALKQGEDKFKEYEEIMPTLLVNSAYTQKVDTENNS